MKKILLISMSMLVISLLFGQNPTKWEVALDAGMNLSKMSGKWDGNNNSKNKWIGSPAVGVIGAYNFTPLIALTAGLYMMKSGARFITIGEDEGGSWEYSQRERYTTLRLPIMARLIWGTTWQYYGLIGFYISKRLCGKYVYKPSWSGEQSGKIKFKKNPDENYSGDDWILDTKEYRRLNGGIQIGAGVRRALGPGFISFNATFGYGFWDLYKKEITDKRPDGYKAYRDMNIALLFGYIYMLGSSL